MARRKTLVLNHSAQRDKHSHLMGLRESDGTRSFVATIRPHEFEGLTDRHQNDHDHLMVGPYNTDKIGGTGKSTHLKPQQLDNFFDSPLKGDFGSVAVATSMAVDMRERTPDGDEIGIAV